MSAAFPRSAIGKVPSARVVLRCGLHSDGRLVDCQTVSEAPADHGFAVAARSLARDFRAIVGPHDQIRDLDVDVPFDFRDPSAQAPPLEIYSALWLRRIDPAAALKLFPPQAAKAGFQDGRAKIRCGIAHDGSLTGCAVQSEDPAGLGFGAAALSIAAVMKMNPWTPQGDPVDGAYIVLPIRLVLASPQSAAQPAAPAQTAAPPPPPAKPRSAALP